MAEHYLPTREGDLDRWASTFQDKISSAPAAFGLSAAQATAFTSLFNSWHASFVATGDNSTRTPVMIQNKKTAKEAMVDGAGGIRQLVNIIQAFPALTDSQRVELGITVPDHEPSPVPVPEDAPLLAIESTLGRTMKLQLRDMDDSERRGKPEGVAGATILMFVGEDAPLDPIQWIFCLNTTRTTVDIDFPPNLAAGAKVWLTAFWRNRRDEPGPAAVPVSTRLGDTIAQAA